MRIGSAPSAPIQPLDEPDALASVDSEPVSHDNEGIEVKRYHLTTAWPQAIDGRFDQLESSVNSKQ